MNGRTKPGISTGSEQAPTWTFIPTAADVVVGSLHSNTFSPLGKVYVSYWRLSNGGFITRVDDDSTLLPISCEDDEAEVVSARAEEAEAGRMDEVANKESMRRRLVMLSADDDAVWLSAREL